MDGKLNEERLAYLRRTADHAMRSWDGHGVPSMIAVPTTILALLDERDALRAFRLEVARTVGIVYETDGCADQPGPDERVLAEVRAQRARVQELTDQLNDREAAGFQKASADFVLQQERDALRAEVASMRADLAVHLSVTADTDTAYEEGVWSAEHRLQPRIDELEAEVARLKSPRAVLDEAETIAESYAEAVTEATP